MSAQSSPFREPAESPTARALSRLRARDVHPIRRACAAIGRYRRSAKASPRRRDVESAEQLGFKPIGNAAEGLFPIFRKRVYVDEARTTQAHLSSIDYFFVTYFESGKCILTWDHSPNTPSSEFIVSRSTAGSFTADYEAHLAAVRERASTDAPIAVRDLADAIQLGDFYYRGIVPLGLAATTVVSVLMPLVFVVWLALRAS